jgi:hypothetical protein
LAEQIEPDVFHSSLGFTKEPRGRKSDQKQLLKAITEIQSIIVEGGKPLPIDSIATVDIIMVIVHSKKW